MNNAGGVSPYSLDEAFVDEVNRPQLPNDRAREQHLNATSPQFSKTALYRMCGEQRERTSPPPRGGAPRLRTFRSKPSSMPKCYKATITY